MACHNHTWELDNFKIAMVGLTELAVSCAEDTEGYLVTFTPLVEGYLKLYIHYGAPQEDSAFAQFVPSNNIWGSPWQMLVVNAGLATALI